MSDTKPFQYGEHGNLPTFVDEKLNTGTQTAIPIPIAETPPEAPKPKNKGGRPKGSKTKKPGEPQPPKPDAPKTETVDEELARLKAGYQKPPEPPPGAATDPNAPQQAQPQQAWKITGPLAMIMIDSLIPTALAFVLNRFGWDNVKRRQLQLTEDERKDIEPILEVVIKDWIIRPEFVLALSLFGAYTSKIPERPAQKAKTPKAAEK